ncbi:hypothetical protein BOTBODRAFT_124666 [Botryobasidium botryosum FD-172 SS1]|uniref:TspO/MBR-related protein n=1 Tax=Botryobasidium botryosum (strain FD-172 SS1) TaxID=930990 RepID=A0A067N9R4_BOTB1|nr:hypothetical protein BOTBODRAFT_124666 [Botryobasidium botryosum FD-172 SS1]
MATAHLGIFNHHLPTALRSLPVAVAIPVAAGLVSGYVGNPRSNFEPAGWYRTLIRSKLTPPNWVFPVAWTALYTAMGYASHRVALITLSHAPLTPVHTRGVYALKLYAAQLALNLVWTPLFFGVRRPGWALLDLAALGGTVFATTFAFNQLDSTAAKCMGVYAAWVTYAGYLNAVVWWKNN